ncbi:MAG: hypothetical protein HYR86_07405, partial [Candidatus Rokubacteria bacterium]|nr:hypothetical protein [Candidatus Rokubacteria bacterium]
KPALLHTLNDLLYRTYRAGRDTLIVVEEGQLIEDAGIFEEIRLLLNVQTDDRFLVTVLLVGSSELRARLAGLDHVEQRIAVRCHVGPFDLAQTAAYIELLFARVRSCELRYAVSHAARRLRCGRAAAIEDAHRNVGAQP